MDEADRELIRQLISAVERLAPSPFEVALGVVSTLLNVVVPVVIAIGVARHGKKTTLDAIARQTDAERNERRMDALREKVAGLVDAVTRQLSTPKDQWQDEFRLVNSAAVALELALPFDMRGQIKDWVSALPLRLIHIRTVQFDDEEAGRPDLMKWVAETRTFGDMLLWQADANVIARVIAWMNAQPAGDDGEQAASPEAEADSAPDLQS